MPADVSKERTFGKYCERGMELTRTVRPILAHIDARALQTASSLIQRLFGQSSVKANPEGYPASLKSALALAGLYSGTAAASLSQPAILRMTIEPVATAEPRITARTRPVRLTP